MSSLRRVVLVALLLVAGRAGADKERAEERYRKALQLRPGSPEATKKLRELGVLN